MQKRQQDHIHRQEGRLLGGDRQVGATHVVLALQEGLADRNPQLGEHWDSGGNDDADVPGVKEDLVQQRGQDQPAAGRGQRAHQRQCDEGRPQPGQGCVLTAGQEIGRGARQAAADQHSRQAGKNA